MPAKQAPKPNATPKKSAGLLIGLAILLAGGGLLVCIGGSVGAWWYLNKRRPDDRRVENPPIMQPIGLDKKDDEPKKDDAPKKIDDAPKKTADAPLNTDKFEPPDKKKKAPPQKPVQPPYVPIANRKIPAAAEFGGLLAYYSFDEIDGDKVKDLADNGIPGTLVGKPTIIDGVRGKAIRLNGSPDQYFDYAAHPLLNFQPKTPFTIAVWCNSERDVGTIVSHRHTRPRQQNLLDITLHQYRLKVEVRDEKGVGKHAEIMNGVLTQNQWHHVAITRKGAVVEFYLDGVAMGRDASASAAGLIASDLRTLGSERYWLMDGSFGNPTWQGAFDELCVFNRALDAKEIASLAGIAE